MKKMMNGILFAAVLFLAFPAVGWTASPVADIVVLEASDIAALSDEKLIDTYIDVLADLEAVRTFHATSGLTPKEYRKYKDLIKSRLRILMEIHRRKLEIPASIQ